MAYETGDSVLDNLLDVAHDGGDDLAERIAAAETSVLRNLILGFVTIEKMLEDSGMEKTPIPCARCSELSASIMEEYARRIRLLWQ